MSFFCSIRLAISWIMVATCKPWVVNKVSRIYRRISNLFRYGDWHFPHAFYIETQEECNRHCFYCPNNEYMRYGRMEDSVFEKVIDRLVELNWAGPISFHRANEPLLDPRLFNFISKVKLRLPNCLPTITTNGDFLTVDLMKKLEEIGVTRVVLSRHPPFTKEWDDRIGEIIQNWPHICQLTQVGKTVKVHTNGQFHWKGIPWQGYCISPTLSLSINHLGDVTLCCGDYFSRAVYGNILQNNIITIWKNPNYVKARKLLRNGIQAHDICKGCSGVIAT